MKTFITETTDGLYAGPEIKASSWEEAETLALKQGVNLVGELA